MDDNNASNKIEEQSKDNTPETTPAINSPECVVANTESQKKTYTDINLLKKTVFKERGLSLMLSAVVSFASLCSAGVAYLQWDTMRNQLSEMRESGQQTDKLIGEITKLSNAAIGSLEENRLQFQQAQRPFLVTHLIPKPHTGSGRAAVDMLIVNYGKTPAVKVNGIGTIFIGKDSMENADKWFETEAPKAFLSHSDIILPQGFPSDTNLRKSSEIQSTEIISEANFQNLLENFMGIIIVSRHVYFDAFGNRYWTDSCFSNLPSSGVIKVLNCPRHNEIH